MKRLFCLLFVLVLLPVVSFADLPDLSSYTLSELHDIYASLRSEILSRSQWESVTVPVGFYVVGEDIPAGHWSIRYAPGEVCLIEYFLKTDDTGKRPADTSSDYYYEGVCDPELQSTYVTYRLTEFDLDLKEGYHVVVNYGPCVFEPFTGRPSPFF